MDTGWLVTSLVSYTSCRIRITPTGYADKDPDGTDVIVLDEDLSVDAHLEVDPTDSRFSFLEIRAYS